MHIRLSSSNAESVDTHRSEFTKPRSYGEAFIIDLSRLDTTALPTPEALKRQAEILSGMRLFDNGVPVTLTRDEWLQRVDLN